MAKHSIEENELLKFNYTGKDIKEGIMAKFKKKGTKGALVYMNLVSKFDIRMVDPELCPTACMFPGKRLIFVNGDLSNKLLEAVIRHEIMHEWYAHLEKLNRFCIAHYDKLKLWMQLEENEELTKNDVVKSMMQYLGLMSNIAGDYEISNKVYSDEDKQIFRALIIGADRVRCLVTDDDHPDWVNLSYSEMMDRLLEEAMKSPFNLAGGDEDDGPNLPPPKMLRISGEYIDSTTFKDEDGDIIDPNDPDNQNYAMTVYADIKTGIDYYWDGNQYQPIDNESAGLESPNIKFINGTYEDLTTFLDADGSNVDFDDPDNKNYDIVVYEDNKTKKLYVWDKEKQILVEIPPLPKDPKVKGVIGKYVNETTFLDELGNKVDFHDLDNDNYDIVIYADKDTTRRYIWNEELLKLIETSTPPQLQSGKSKSLNKPGKQKEQEKSLDEKKPELQKKSEDEKKSEEQKKSDEKTGSNSAGDGDGENNWSDEYSENTLLDEVGLIMNDPNALLDFENDYVNINPDNILKPDSKTSWGYIGLTSSESLHTSLDLIKSIKKNLIALAIEEGTIIEPTWKYLDLLKLGAGIIHKGTKETKVYTNKKPAIYIYLDVSSSWGASDLQLAKEVLASLKLLNDQGIIQAELRYFASKNKVSENPNDVGSGTRGEPVIDSINKIKPANVMIVTDSDVTSISKEAVKVKGCVWFVWNHGLVSEEFKNKISGKKVFEFDMR